MERIVETEVCQITHTAITTKIEASTPTLATITTEEAVARVLVPIMPTIVIARTKADHTTTVPTVIKVLEVAWEVLVRF